MSLRWFFIIFAVAFLLSFSRGKQKFLPQTSGERAALIVAASFLALVAIGLLWILTG